jgi:hypothetical protein
MAGCLAIVCIAMLLFIGIITLWRFLPIFFRSIFGGQ